MLTIILLLGFAVAVVGLLVVTPSLETWATSAPSPLDLAAGTVVEPLESAQRLTYA